MVILEILAFQVLVVIVAYQDIADSLAILDNKALQSILKAQLQLQQIYL